MARAGLSLLAGLLLLPPTASTSASQIFGAKPPVQYVTVEAGPSGVSAAPGATLSLWLDVTPKAKIHVYGEGAKGFTSVALTLSPVRGVTAAKPKYPPTELVLTPGIEERVPVYSRLFRITQPVTIDRSLKPGSTVNLTGTLKYESCDDRLCYPLATLPVSWIVNIR